MDINENIGRRTPAMARWKGFRNKAERCYYCLVSVEDLRSRGIYMTVDHVLPKCKGGSNEEANLVSACERCNNMKNDSLDWYEGCVALEAFDNPEWFRDMLLHDQEVAKEQATIKRKRNVEDDDWNLDINWINSNRRMWGEY